MTTQIEYVPSVEDIAAATAEIRGRWSVDELIRRRRVRPQRSVETDGVEALALESLAITLASVRDAGVAPSHAGAS